MGNKVAVVTGATGTLGREIVGGLLVAGAAVIAVGRSRTKLIEHLPAHLNLTDLPANLQTAEAAHLETLLRSVTDHVDLLVCAHGTAPVITPSHLLTAKDFCAVYETDVLGTLKIAQAVYPLMQAKGGSMVFVSSLHAKQTYPARAAYASSKAAVCGLMRTLALEWAGDKIRVNAILPWQCEGPRTERFIADAAVQGVDLHEAYLQRTPLRRLIQPEEVAEAVLFLTQHPGMTGAELVLDGGVSASMWYQPFREKPQT